MSGEEIGLVEALEDACPKCGEDDLVWNPEGFWAYRCYCDGEEE